MQQTYDGQRKMCQQPARPGLQAGAPTSPTSLHAGSEVQCKGAQCRERGAVQGSSPATRAEPPDNTLARYSGSSQLFLVWAA
jgi:hypothetical protein